MALYRVEIISYCDDGQRQGLQEPIVSFFSCKTKMMNAIKAYCLAYCETDDVHKKMFVEKFRSTMSECDFDYALFNNENNLRENEQKHKKYSLKKIMKKIEKEEIVEFAVADGVTCEEKFIKIRDIKLDPKIILEK